jgi:hypothetical protein
MLEPHGISIRSRPLPDVQMKIYLGRGDVLMPQILPDDLQGDTLIKLPGGAYASRVM